MSQPANRNLPEQEIEELRTILDFVSDGILVTDENSQVIMINKHHKLLEFASPEEIVGKTIPQLVDEGYYIDLKPVPLPELKEFLLSKHVVNFEMITRMRRRLLSTANPILNARNDIKYIVYTSRDITEFEQVRHDLEKENALRRLYQNQLYQKEDPNIFSFNSPSMHKIHAIAKKVAKVDSPVFLTGQSGVGKTIIARKIHALGSRAHDPFIHINCAAIPESLFESEVFGYEDGAFTGAKRQGKPGLLELAGSGIVFLDEIAELSCPLQAKLLQVLQEEEFRRVGGTQSIKMRARVISATNGNVAELMRTGRFREDLYYRLCVVPIHIPPLNERQEDIMPMAEMFLRKYTEKYGVNKQFDSQLADWMHSYPWPGNVRELQNLVELLVIVSDAEVISLNDLLQLSPPIHNVNNYITLEDSISLKAANEKVEKVLIERVIKNSSSTRDAAQALGISQSTLLRKAHKYSFADQLSNNQD
ncbi:MAG: sigma-54 interaction domain-containing protein [Methylocystaceae bacterium]